jgi:hypothetical protein
MKIMLIMKSNLKLREATISLPPSMAHTFQKKPRHMEGKWVLVAINAYLNKEGTDCETTILITLRLS